MSKNSNDSGKAVQKLIDYWQARSTRQRAILAAAFAATFLAVAGFGWLAGRQPMALLYGGLDAAQAGSVMADLDRRKVPYQIRGESIWVPAGERDRLRLDLAAQGLPEAGAAGYELLDGLSGFGTTSQMFDAAYWRAKEGELARTILASSNVRAARVHLAVPTGRGWQRDSAGAASVTVTTGGAEITREQAQALRYLVASGVPGMAPDAVTVIDSRRGVVSADAQAATDREERMKRDVERILTAHVGAGNAIVELNLDIETRAEQLSERRFDPAERAMISQEVEETSDTSSESQPGAVTAASNLPDAQGRDDGQSSASRETSRQRANFEVSETRRDVIAAPGDVRRLTVAVLINGTVVTAPDGTQTVQPRSEAELAGLRELVASAVGLNEARGDQLTVKSMPFAAPGDTGTLAIRPGLMERLALNDLARLMLVGVFALAFALLVLRPMLAARAEGRTAGEAEALPPPAPLPALTPAPEAAAAAAAGAVMADAPPPAAIPRTEPEISFAPPQPAQSGDAGEDGDPVTRLRRLMRERHHESVHVLSHWIADKDKEART